MRHTIRCLDSVASPIDVNVYQTFNLFASFYTSVKSFVSATADFRTLTTGEQGSLFDRNLHGLFNFCGTFMLREAGMFDNERNESLIVPLYGREAVRDAKRIIRRLDIDSSLVKMIHILFAFSTNCYTVAYDPHINHDALLLASFRLLGSQNFYTEILWKYMIYRYGFEESVLRFAALVKHMLDLIVLSANIYTDNPHHQVLVDDLVEEAKTELLRDDSQTSPLWGKT